MAETTRSSTVREDAKIEKWQGIGATATEGGQWHYGLDVSLLLVRLITAAIMGAHGLVKVFGFFGGPGMHAFTGVLRGFGFTRGVSFLAWMTGLTEVGCAVLLILGLFTPLAAAGLLGISSSLVYSKFGGGFFEGAGTGFEYELLLAILMVLLLLSGSGRLALDAPLPWRKRPLPYGTAGIVLAAVAAIVIIAAFGS